MKNSFNSLSRLSQIALAVATVTSAPAASLYFDSASNTLWDDATTLDWSAVPAGPYTALWTSGSDATFEGTAGTVNVSGTITSVNSIVFTTDGYQLGSSAGSGTLTLTGAGGNITTGAGNDTIDSIVAGTVGLTKLGTGTLTLAAGTAASGTYLNKNTFSGAVNVSAGILVLAPTPFSPNNVLTPGLFGGTAVAGNNVTIASGATLKAGTGTNGVLNGIQRMTLDGTLDLNGTNGAVGSNFANGIGGLSGSGVIANAASGTLSITGTGSDETFSGTFSSNVGGVTINQCHNNSNALRGGIQILNIGGGTGSATFGSLSLGASNAGESTLKLVGGTLTVGGLSMSSNSNGQMLVDGGTFNVNSGGNFMIGNYGWNKNGQVRFIQTNGTVNVNGATGNTTLGIHYNIPNTYWEPSDAMTFSGGTFTCGRTLSVTEGDTGVLTTTNPGRPSFVTVSGTAAVTIPAFTLGKNGNGGFAQFDLNGGTLSTGSFTKYDNAGLNGYASTAIVNFNGGTLQATASGPLFTGFTPGSNTVPAQANGVDVYKNLNTAGGGNINIIGLSDALTVKTGGAIIDTNGKVVSITPGLAGAPGDGGLTVKNTAGTGKLILGGTNTYYGSTMIQSGTLALTGSATIANTPVINVPSGAVFDVIGLSSAFTLAASQTLQGSGTVMGPMQVAGTLAPGNGVDTFNTDNVTFSGGSTLAVAVNGTSNGILASSGALNISGAALTVTLLGGGFTQPSYLIVDASGGITGTFASVPAGYTVTYSETQAILSQAAGTDYDTWKGSFGVGFTNTAATADPDGDGLTNQQEYAFGLNPTLGSSVNPVSVPFDKGTGTLSYTRRTQSLTGLGYTILTSTSLGAGSWTTDTGAVQVPASPVGDIETVHVTVSAALLTNPKLFVRVVAQ